MLHSLLRSRRLILCCLALTVAPCPADPLQKWMYLPANLLPDALATEAGQLVKRAGAAGYDHILLADSKFCRLAQMPRAYFDHIKALQKIAAESHVEIVPAVFPVGYSNDMLANDPNLAEGLPVKDALFEVRDGAAHAVTEGAPLLRNGAFADTSRNNGWNIFDPSVHMEEGMVLMHNPQGKNSRFTQALHLQPFHVYHLTIELRAQAFTADPAVKLLVPEGELNYAYLKAKRTQDWTTHHVIFNTLDHSDISLYIGAWGAKTGDLQWRNATLEEAGLVNLLRREGCPLTVKKEDGTVLEEGKDYEPVHDPSLGMVPYGGCYEVWHQPPVIKTHLPSGTKLRVSFYHSILIYDEQVCACPSEPKFNELLCDQAHRVQDAWTPSGFMMSHDEWRVMNWCEACQKRHLDAGAMAAQSARDCIRFVREVSPKANIYVWNDMFDPYHNAVDHYYLVRGNLANSWEGLSSDVIIMNWNLGHLEKSLGFFAKRGHRQIIAGYYDGDVHQLSQHLAAAKGVKGVIGVMYTTWHRNYTDLEAFAKIADAEWK